MAMTTSWTNYSDDLMPDEDFLHLSVTVVEPPKWISDEAFHIFKWICYAVVCELVDIFGTVTNIINIICFVKQGFKDPVNVSFLGLAISDLGSVMTLIWTNLSFNPLFYDAMESFDAIEIAYLTAGWPHVIFTRVTSWITALITLERCLCITMPLKVKSLITPKRVTVIIIVIYVILICSVSPVYYANRFGMNYSPAKNRTILRLVYTEDRYFVEEYSFAINNLLIPFGAFVTVIVCTVTLVVKLRSKAEWRKTCTGPVKGETTSERDQKVSRMVVMISALFISCFVPLCFTFIAVLVEPEISMGGRYQNTLLVLGGFNFLLESLNSSMNIFIYYHMSSKYRAVFRQLFRLEKRNE